MIASEFKADYETDPKEMKNDHEARNDDFLYYYHYLGLIGFHSSVPLPSDRAREHF